MECRSAIDRHATLVAIAWLAAACATAPPLPADFPTAETLRALAQKPAPGNLLSAPSADVAEWTFAEPAVTRVVVQNEPAGDPWSDLLRGLVEGSGDALLPSRGLHCAARELTRFYLEERGFPAQPLQGRILARCGAAVAEVRPGFLFGTIDERLSDEDVLRSWAPQVAPLLRGLLVPGPQNVGIAYARSADRAAAVVLAGSRIAELEDTSAIANSAGIVAIRGHLSIPAESVQGIINHGRFGYADCARDPLIELPNFALACRMDARDAEARITVSATPPKRLVARAVVEVLARRSDSDELHYVRHDYASAQQVVDRPGLASALHQLINRVRSRGGLEPVEVDVPQSRITTELTPHLLAGLVGGADPMTTDAIVLGLVSGWEVAGIIRSGHLTAGAVGPTQDASQLLASMLEAPSGRAVLLRPDVRKVAIGPFVMSDPPVLGAAVAGYTFFDPSADARQEQRFFERLVREREARGLQTPSRISSLSETAAEYASLVNRGSSTPARALSGLMQASIERLNRPVRGLCVESNDLEQLPLPEELFRKGPLEVLVAVTHRQRDGWPWGSYVVFVVIPGPPALARAP